MEKPKDNKGYVPVENKATRPPVKIRFGPGRAGAGVTVQEDGTALASAEQADYWVKIGYAEIIEKKESS